MSSIDFATFLNDDKATLTEDKAPESKSSPDKTQPSSAGDELKLTDDDDLEPESEEDDEEDSEKESEEDEEDSPEDEKKLVLDDDADVNIVAPNRAKILKEFPELFKKFPTIEKAIYREQQYAEVFPHPKDAEEAKQGLKVLANIESELGQGNIENLLSSVKKFDEKAFNQITDNFLPTLKKLNPQSYFSTVNYVVKTVLSQANEFGSKADKESDQYQIGLAARIINKWIYNEAELKAPAEIGSETKKAEVSPKEIELDNREKAFHQQALSTAVQEVDDKILSTLNRSVDSAIDPKNLMTPYVKKNAVKEVLDQFRVDLKKDKRFVTNLDHLWKLCRDDNYSDTAKARIRKAILKQGNEVLPDIMRRVKADALKDYKKVARPERESERPLDRRRPSSGIKSSSSKSNGKFQLPEGKTAREFLLED